MNKFDKGENSIMLAMQYRDIRLTAEELNKYNGSMTKECRKYLIGKTCEREKKHRVSGETVMDVYMRIGSEFGYKRASLQHVVSYACAIDKFYKVAPDIAADILAGRVRRLSGENAIILSKMDINDISIIIERLTSEKTPVEVVFKDQKRQLRITKREKREQKVGGASRKSIKDTPPYDPESQIMALVYTIPSWISTIESAFMNTDFDKVSLSAHRKLIKGLNGLKDIVGTTVSLLREEKY